MKIKLKMNKVLKLSAFFAYAVLVGLLFQGCSKKDKVMSLPGSEMLLSNAKVLPPPPPADPAIAYTQNGKIMVMNADGSNQTAIASPYTVGRPSWSPDGTHITALGKLTSSNAQGILIVDVSVLNGIPTGSNLHQVTIDNLTGAGNQVSWSPVGDLLVFGGPDAGDIYTVPSAGGTATLVYTPPSGFFAAQADWSPDASKLVFKEAQSSSPYQTSLKIIDLASNQVTTIIPNFSVRFPAWSRHGDRIAFSSQSTNPEAIYTVTPVANSTLVKVVDGAAAPTWSPDDSKLAIDLFSKSTLVIATYNFGTKATQSLASGTNLHPVGNPNWRRF